ncbi:HET-domain-containing protein [Glonium stellatum]|uniref:HET-domain-containing protein n=1 Tax=Glonium stellatum TaxID=574774 RepID=A0A8E2JMS0_9PEZI|nr:HET-domain-containing protein [Glonium stellatum]
MATHDTSDEQRLIPDEELDPVVGPVVDAGRVRSWILDCEENHGPRCNIAEHHLASTTRDLRLIDVVIYQVLEAPSDARYLALSYVWGQVTQLHLTRSNCAELSTPYSLQSYWDEIPKVIQDAIRFTARLQERYLWVDSLCIVQDDAASKHHQILQMAAIYNGALATIVAATGTDATNPLAGVDSGSRQPERRTPLYHNVYLVDPGPFEYLGRRLKARQLDLFDKLLKSAYNTRAWTYQEQILSRRCLFFMDHMLFFQCRSCIRGENKASPYSEATRDIRELSLFVADPIFSGDPSMYHRTLGAIYAKIVTMFTRKKLSYPGITAAMQNICKWRFIFGLPEQLFDYALLWASTQPKRRQPPSLGNKLNNALPSWSWAGWDAESDYEFIFRVEAGYEPYLASMESFIDRYYLCDGRGSYMIQRHIPINYGIAYNKVEEAVLQEEIKDCVTRISNSQLPTNLLVFWAYVIPYQRWNIYSDRVVDSFCYAQPHVGRIDRAEMELESMVSAPLTLFGLTVPPARHPQSENYDIVILSAVKDRGFESSITDFCYVSLNAMLIRWNGDFAERVAIGYIDALSNLLNAESMLAWLKTLGASTTKRKVMLA